MGEPTTTPGRSHWSLIVKHKHSRLTCQSVALWLKHVEIQGPCNYIVHTWSVWEVGSFFRSRAAAVQTPLPSVGLERKANGWRACSGPQGTPHSDAPLLQMCPEGQNPTTRTHEEVLQSLQSSPCQFPGGGRPCQITDVKRPSQPPQVIDIICLSFQLLILHHF